MESQTYIFKFLCAICFSFIIILNTGCKKEMKNVDFLMNSQNITASDTEPDVTDSLKILSVYVGDSIYIKDKSSPTKNVSKRGWDTNGDGLINRTDEEFFPIAFSNSGTTKITLFINEEAPVTKWINVKDDDSYAPRITFQSHIDGDVSKKRNIQIQASLKKVYDKDNIIFTVNDVKQKFEFDTQTELLTANVRLSNNENIISIEAENDDDITNKNITVTYTPASTPAPVGPSPKPRPAIYPKFDAPTRVYAGTEVSFKNTTPGAISCSWYFGDGTTSTELNPRHTYQFDGTYEVALTTNNSNAKTTQKIIVIGTTKVTQKPIIGKPIKTKPAVKKPDNSEPQGLASSAGVPTSARQASCSTPSAESYSFTITPKQAVELIEFTVFSDRCGGLKVSIGGATTTSGLNPGQNQIPLSDLNKVLKKGQSYTVTCTTISGYACSDTQKPKLENGKACNGSSKSSPHLTINDNNQSIIYNLQYLY